MVKIGTHSGHFHADESLAVFMLRQLPEFAQAEVVRSRDLKVLDECDIVVDVGAKFDPEAKRFDHHQREFNETMKSLGFLDFETKLSSAGLVYAYYGKAVINAITGLDKTSPKMDIVYHKMYEKFIEEYDGIDNGVNQYDGEPKYKISSLIGARVGSLNPRWNDEDKSEARENSQFRKAMEMIGAEFTGALNSLVKSWLPAFDIVSAAIDARTENGKLIMFESSGCPWKEHLFNIESKREIVGSIKYVVYRNKPTDWRIQCVPVSPTSFSNRLSLPEAWRGVRDAKLAEVCGVDGATFCHASGFIGGCATKEGVLEMAKKALSQ